MKNKQRIYGGHPLWWHARWRSKWLGGWYIPAMSNHDDAAVREAEYWLKFRESRSLAEFDEAIERGLEYHEVSEKQ